MSTLIAGPAAQPTRRPMVDLFLVSFLILFFELACIRWFGATVVFLTFFTNIILMACFLGMSVGCMTASRARNLATIVLPVTLLAVAMAWAVLWHYERNPGVEISVGGQASPQLIYFGTEYRANNPSKFVVPIEVVAGVFFTLVALIFVGLGQVMGRAFDVIPNRVGAYLVNILGSLAGIAAFGVASYLKTNPVWWFGISLGLMLYFLPRLTWLQFLSQAGAIIVIAVSSYVSLNVDRAELLYWSPYYKIAFAPKSEHITTNNIAHQQMFSTDRAWPAYRLPHLLRAYAPPGVAQPAFEDASAPRPDTAPYGEVLIIGAGSGNDVAAALAAGAKHVDAVEIDPVIANLGRWWHPDKPYNDPRVTLYLDDGRSFLKKTRRKYDLVIYALVDSLVLQSGYSSLRLESFLFTEEAFRDIKNVLADGGVFCMYNYYRQGWVVGRLKTMAERVFGGQPLVMSMAYQERITPSDNQADFITCILAAPPVSHGATVVEQIKQRFDAGQSLWVHNRAEPGAAATFSAEQAPTDEQEKKNTHWPRWTRIAPATVVTDATPTTPGIGPLPSDNWPFLYLRDPSIPGVNLRGMAVIAVLSLAVLLLFNPGILSRSVRPNGQMFFLGAGFMLLETKGVVHMALLFGSTWIVNSVVFFAILVMIAAANFLVLAVKPKNLLPWYLLLAAALLVNALVPMSWFLQLPGVMKTVASCAVIFVPVFFAGVIFATAFRDSKKPAVDMGFNILGVILGGLSEYLSLVIGFNGLIFIAVGYYALSLVLRPRTLLGARAAPSTS